MFKYDKSRVYEYMCSKEKQIYKMLKITSLGMPATVKNDTKEALNLPAQLLQNNVNWPASERNDQGNQ